MGCRTSFGRRREIGAIGRRKLGLHRDGRTGSQFRDSFRRGAWRRGGSEPGSSSAAGQRRIRAYVPRSNRARARSVPCRNAWRVACWNAWHDRILGDDVWCDECGPRRPVWLWQWFEKLPVLRNGSRFRCLAGGRRTGRYSCRSRGQGACQRRPGCRRGGKPRGVGPSPAFSKCHSGPFIKFAGVQVASRRRWHCCSGSSLSCPTASRLPRNWQCCCSSEAT